MKKQPVIAVLYLSLFIAILFFAALRRINQADALSRGFIQTDWSGGADTVSTTDDTYLTTWTKYYSADSGITATIAGELRLKVEVTSP